MKKLLIVSLLILLVIFASGCVQKAPTGAATAKENAAISEIEKELDQAIQNITMEDIEKALVP